MCQVSDLATLQAYDSETSALRAALSDVELRLHGDSELDTARRNYQRAEATVADLRKDQRRVEGQIADFTAKIDPEERRLYDGSVRNPKELQSIQHEVEGLSAHRNQAEDELLEVMSRIEAADRELTAAKKQLSDLESRWEHRKQELRLEALRLGDAIALADQRRERQKSLINPRVLATYEDLRKRKGGTAVARLQAGVCTGCRIQVPDAVRRKAFSPALIAQCPSCERILTVG
jgi:predicted  nucleic acid-binding Zn-ribbon protein